MSRASTMLLALLILNVLLGVLCLVVARGSLGERDDSKSRALRLWGLGLLVYSVGILITLPDFLPFGLRKVVGNSLITFAPVLAIEGALSHTRFRLNRRWTAIAVAASVLPIVVNHLRPQPIVLVDILAPAPIANVLFVIATWVLLREPPPEAVGAARFLAAIFASSVAVWSLRMVAIWESIGGSNDRDRADLIVALFGIAQIVNAVAATLGLLWVEVRKKEAAYRRLADFDPLTGLPNRRATLERFREASARATRDRRLLGVAVIDVDHFKRVNDTHGHVVGDAALRHLAATLSAQKRQTDVIGRLGGEEFVALLDLEPNDDVATAAEGLRSRVAGTALEHGSLTLGLTVSGGLALFPNEGSDWDQLFAIADRRLYSAKNGGRNRIEIAG